MLRNLGLNHILLIRYSKFSGLSDFDLMLMKKKEEQSKRRKRKDIDIINDNDDIIAQLISDMKHAAEVRKCSQTLRTLYSLIFVVYIDEKYCI